MAISAISATREVRSVPALLQARIEATADAEALRYRAGDGWQSLTWREVGARVRDLAAGLRALGAGDQQRVAILSDTRVEWVLADLAVLAAGCATTTVYPSTTPEDCAFIISDSGSRVAIAENRDQVAKLRSIRDRIPQVANVVVIDGEREDDAWVITLEDLRERGRQRDVEHPES